MENDRMQLESRMKARFVTFFLIAVTGYRFHAVRRVEIIGYFVRFGHPILFCVFHCKNKTIIYYVVISHTVQL